jgi:hypothetical protein
MRNFKKILIAICVIALLSVGCVVMAFAADGEDAVTNKGTIEELNALISTAESASDAQSKYDALSAVNSYLLTKDMCVDEMDDVTKAIYDAAMLRIQRASVVGADMSLTAIPEDLTVSGTNLDAALTNFLNADSMLHWFEIPETTAGFSAVIPKYDAAFERVAMALVNNLSDGSYGNKITNTAENKVKLNRVNSVITYCVPYGNADFLTDIKAKYEICLAAHEAAVQSKLEALDNVNDMNSYDLPVFYEEDWEEIEIGYYTKEEFPIVTNRVWNYDDKGISNKVGIRAEENGNKYYVHEYHEQVKPQASFVQRSLSDCNVENGLVFEFDVATFGEVPKAGIKIETGGIGGLFPPPYLQINGNGDIVCTNKSGQTDTLLKGALVRGGWIRIIITFNPDTFEYTLYVEGQKLGSYPAGNAQISTFNHANAVFRLTGGASTQGEIAYDNIKIYSGLGYRSQDKLAKMSDEEKFIYFVDYVANERNPILDRKGTYDKASELLSNYWAVVDPDAETPVYDYTDIVMEDVAAGNVMGLKAAVDAYLAVNIDNLVAEAKSENLSRFIQKVNTLRNEERSTNVTLRALYIKDIELFVKENKNLIDYEADNYSADTGEKVSNGLADYAEYEAIMKAVIKEVDYDTNASEFIKYMERFLSATSLSSTDRYYNTAKEFIEGGKVDLDILTNPDNPNRANFAELLDAYDSYLNAYKKVDEVTRNTNSKKIVKVISSIIQYRTEEEWLANEELMNTQLSAVKDIILGSDASGNLLYNTNYDGIDESIRFFNGAYGFFYNKIQNEHDAYIGGLLELMASSNDYIVKLGIIARIDRYLATNEVDYEDDRFVAHLANLETVRSELVLREKDYAQVLRQNSVYFVNYVEKMRTATNYDEQVAYFEEAALIFFSLDSSVEGVAAAKEIYVEYRDKLALIKESSIEFIAAVEVYKSVETRDEKYAALVDCYYYVQFAEPTYTGVAEALEVYNAAYDAHMSYATATNTDITATGHAVGSFRTNCKVTTIIAIIVKKIFE